MKDQPTYQDLLERMRIIIEHSNEVFYLHDIHHVLSYVSPTSEKILGYTPEEMMITWTDITTDNPINQRGVEITEKAIKTGVRHPPYHLELRKKDGSLILVEVAESPIKDNTDTVVAIVGALRDVTETKRAEKALRESEERFRDMAELLPEIIFEIDHQGTLTFVNQSAYAQFQYSEEDFNTGLNAIEMIAPEDRQRGLANISKILKGEHVGLKEYRALRKDGSTFPALFHSAAIIRDGTSVGLRGIIIDITERKKMLEALEESEANYRQLFNHAPAGIYEFDIQKRRFLSVNDIMCEYTGYSKEEFMNLDTVDLLSEDSLPILEELLEKVAAGENNPDPVEYRIKGKNQREFWVSVHSRFTYDANGHIWKVTGVAHDVSERRQAEEEKKRLEEKLRQVQKMEALGTLSGGIAHDFNNLMTGILGNTSLMLFDLDEHHEYYERLKQIESLVKRGADLTRQLLGLSRRGRFTAVATDLNPLISEAVDIYGRTKKDIQIHTHLQENLWTVVIDRGQIEQVLLNLFINAWQAMPDGGEIHIETLNHYLDNADTAVYKIPAGRYVKISVTDTGIGMDKTTQQKVFDPFFTTKAMERGTGLGLASAYGIVQSHKGMIHVYSEPGRGSTFTFYLPASEQKDLNLASSETDIVHGTGSILLIDDEKVVVEAGKSILEKLGYRVTTATSATEALAVFAEQANRFDMVILDLIMPKMGGAQAFEKLKRIDKQVKVLLSSGYSINAQVDGLLALGCKGFIQKPFTVHELSKEVGRILS